MVKVLLVFEDYNELSATESVLKKVGFDVVGINNEVLLPDQMLSFNPDILIAYGRSTRVSSFSIGQKMKEKHHKFHGKVVIVFPKDYRPPVDEILKMRMDALQEAPLEPEKLIHLLARLSGQSAKIYLEKLLKTRYSEPEKQSQFVRSQPQESAQVLPFKPVDVTGEEDTKGLFRDAGRVKKYEKFTQGIQFDIEQSTHQRKDLQEKQRELKKDWDFESLEELDQLKREFAEALFRKK